MIKVKKGTVTIDGMQRQLLGDFAAICLSLINNKVSDESILCNIVKEANKHVEVSKNETDKPRRNI